MTDNELSYKILRHIQQTEQQSPTLTHIQHDFYTQLTNYLQELIDIVNQEQDPNKKTLYEEEQKNTAKIGQRIYEQREKKIVQAALSKVRGAQPDLSNLLDPEITLFQTLVHTITNHRSYIQKNTTPPIESKKEPTPNKAPKEEPPPDTEAEAPVKPKKTKQPDEPKPAQSPNKNPIIRITEDIPCFVGTDMHTYHLRKNDVLSIAPDMAETLQKRKVASLIR